MTTRRRMVVGSLAGAAAIHLAMLACSGAGSNLTGDGGANDAGRADVTGVDGTTTDAGARDAGFLDTLLDAVRDVIGEVADAEVRDAHAGGDGGVADGGATACACPPPPVPATYSFSGRATGLPIFGPSSLARVEVRAIPPGSGPFGMPDPVAQVAVGFTAWMSRNRGPSPPTTYVTIACIGLRADATGRVFDGGQMTCRAHILDEPDTSSDNSVQAFATLTTLSATQVEVRIASLAFPDASGHFVGPAFTDLVFRATDPNGHYTAPLSAYVP